MRKDNKPVGFIDRKAPRFNKMGLLESMLTRSMFRRWRRKDKSRRNIAHTEFNRIWWTIAETIIECIVEERDGVRLDGIGDMYIGYKLKEGRRIDYQLTEKYNKVIYHDHFDAGNKTPSVVFEPTIKGTRKRWWWFTPSKGFRTKVHRAVAANGYAYKNRHKK